MYKREEIMLIEKPFFAILILLLWTNMLFGQEIKVFNPDIQISPNAASLGIFGNIPVGHYTGTAEINIPIYQIDLDGMKIPIEMAYHSSGIRVAQEASWVGLGWGLRCGGMITRQVYGSPDFAAQVPSSDFVGYQQIPNFDKYYNEIKIDGNASPSPDDPQLNKFNHLVEHGDFEPDIFTFQINGNSGKMIFENPQSHNLSEYKATFLNPANFIDVSYNPSKGTYVAHDGKGYTYYFGTSELTYSGFSSSLNWQLDELRTRFLLQVPQFQVRAGYKYPGVESTWLLDSIVSPQKKAVRFLYEQESIQGITTMGEIFRDYYYDLSTEEHTGDRLLSERPNRPLQELDGGRRIYFKSSVVKQAILRKILFDEGEIIFSTSRRKDLLTNNDQYSQKLEKIEVININNQVIQTSRFYYSYWGDSTSNYSCRLMLDSLNVSGQSSYRFSYDKGFMPSKHSLDTDHWGYYSGPRSISPTDDFYLIPSFVGQYGAFSSNFKQFKGRDKKSNADFMARGLLKSITYPTGATDELTFEPHNIKVQTEDGFAWVNKTDVLLALDDADLSDSSPMPTRDDKFLQEDFSITHGNRNTKISITHGKDVDNNTGNMDKNTSFFVRLQKRQIDGTYKNVNLSSNTQPRFFIVVSPTIMFKKEDVILGSLESGDYRVQVEKGNEYANYFSIGVNVSTDEQQIHQQIGIGGGLRVSKIETSDRGKQEVRSFRYGSPELMVDPVYNRNVKSSEVNYVWNAVDNQPVRRPELDLLQPVYYFEASSESFTPLSYSARGSMVGYTSVVEFKSNSPSDIGYTEYEFYNNSDQTHYFEGQQYSVPTVSDPRNGLLKRISTFGVADILVKSEEFDYKSVQYIDIPCILKTRHVKPVSDYYALPNYQFVAYHQHFETFRLNKIDTKVYQNGTISTFETFDYDPQYNIKVSESRVNSRGEKLQRQYVFPFAFADYVSQEMVRRYMHEVPVETIDFVENKVVGANRGNYEVHSGRVVLAQFEETNNVPGLNRDNYRSEYRKKESYSHFNSYGKPRVVIIKERSPVIYLWSFSGKYPVIKIKNISYEDFVSSIGGEAIVRQLEEQSAESVVNEKAREWRIRFPHAEIQNYTFSPLIGISSSTDANGRVTHYKYDNYNRLETIIDRDLKAIKKFIYHFRM